MLKSLFTLSSGMEYHILTTENKDLPRVVDLNQDALPAVSSITLNDMTQFLEIADYFRVIKVKNDIAGDVNEDGSLDILDIVAIVQVIGGIELI